MDRSELLFRNGCQKWHAYLERCAKDGRFGEASHLLRKISQYLDNWKESLAVARTEMREAEKRLMECRGKEASIHLRMRMLQQLLAVMDHKVATQARQEVKKAKTTKREQFEREQVEKKEKKEKEEREKEERKRNRKNQPGGDNE